jgi:transcriptional regulator with XRE-family HTH domain
VYTIGLDDQRSLRGGSLEFIRIGEKLIDRNRIDDAIEALLRIRSEGGSQQEAADRVGVDRTFVSRLETLGEVRKGGKIALIGFPVSNKSELASIAREYGVDLVVLMTEEERWAYVDRRSGARLVNEVMDLIRTLQGYDSVVFIGSDMRIRLIKSILKNPVIGIEIGRSPLREDKKVDPDMMRSILSELRSQSPSRGC